MIQKIKFITITLTLLAICSSSATATYFLAPKFFHYENNYTNNNSSYNQAEEKQIATQSEQVQSDQIKTQIATEPATLIQNTETKIQDNKNLKQQSTSPTPISLTQKTNIDQLTKSLIKYFQLDNDNNLAITAQTAKHAQGQLDTKWWLAIYSATTNDWRVVASGSSYINCADIVGYHFPSDMVPACWDYGSNQLIER